jgi:hypothetical protein
MLIISLLFYDSLLLETDGRQDCAFPQNELATTAYYESVSFLQCETINLVGS